MPNLTTPAFASIDTSDLTDVLGGCGKKKCRCSKSVASSTINNYYGAPPAPAPAPAPSSGVDVSVSYGSQTATASV